MISTTKLVAVDAYIPEKKLTNMDLEKMIETSDEWITRRTGIKERRIADSSEFASTMAIHAVENLIAHHNVYISDVDMIIVSTFTPDHYIPSVSCLVQQHFQIENCGAIDLNAACSGFVYALTVANGLITCGANKKILVIASETVSKTVDYTDRGTCILFGDGAGVALLQEDPASASFIASYSATNGVLGDKLYCSNLSQSILGEEVIKQRQVVQDGKAIFNFATKEVALGIQCLLKRAKLAINDIDWFVPHSANKRIIDLLCKKLDFPIENTLTSVQNFGNTSSASIPLALNLALEKNIIKKGDTLLLYGFGGGVTQAGTIIKW